MPIDPNLSLQVGPQGTQAQYNPLGMMKDVMDIQGKAQGLEQGRRELAAKARAGQIFATSTDPQDAYQKLQKDPLTAAYAQDLATGALDMQNKIFSGQQTQTQTQGLQQGQFKDAFSAAMQMGLAALKTDDPAGNFTKATNAYLQTQPAAIRKQIEPALKNMAQGIFSPGDTPQQSSQKLMGAFMGAGGSVSQLQPYLPSYNQPQTFGAQTQYGTIRGPLEGNEAGQFQPTTPATIGAVGPSSTVSAGGPVVIPAIPAQAAGGGGQQSQSQGPVTVGGGNALMGGGGGSAPQANVPTGGLNTQPPTEQGFGTARQQFQQAGTAAKMREDFYGQTANDEYDATNTSMMQLKQLDQTLTKLGEAGGFTQPGSFGSLRGEMAKIVNTAAGVFGKDPAFDPNVIANWEKGQKLTTTMAANLAKSLTRGPEAAQTIQNIGSAVPGIDNTVLGNKMVVASIQAQLQRTLDKRMYQKQWLDSKGTLEGSVEGFNKDHPPQKYADEALAPFGIEGASVSGESKPRFKSVDDLQKAVQGKLLTPQEAAAIARSDPRLVEEIKSRKK